MREFEKKDFAEIITGLAMSFGVEAGKPLLRGYWLGLSDLDLQAVEVACTRALRERKHFPRPHELRELAGVMANADRAAIAWGAVSKAVRTCGAYQSVDFDDPIVNATVRNLGGWRMLCGKGVEDFEIWTRKEFERVYCALASSGVTADGAKYLAGAHETANDADGWDVLPPVRIPTGLPAHGRPVVFGSLSSGKANELIAETAGKLALTTGEAA